MNENTKIRPAMVAGLFYPQKKITLDRELAILLENAPEVKISGKLFGLVAPHAGYLYSGGVAARAYRLLINMNIDTVVIIAPSHREYFEEVSVYDGLGYSTPLGTVEVDTELAKSLAQTNPKIILSEKGHRYDEHSLEVHLPFLQKVLDNFKILAVMMGEQKRDNIEALAEGLAEVLQAKKAMIIASSDLSHFYSYDRAAILDNVVLENIKKYDDEKLLRDIQTEHCEMCGNGPVIAAMKACRMLGADTSEVLLYRNSGDVTGDKSEVVGYMSAAFYRKLKTDKEN